MSVFQVVKPLFFHRLTPGRLSCSTLNPLPRLEYRRSRSTVNLIR